MGLGPRYEGRGIMPIWDWQTVVALACVAGAGALIARRCWRYLHPVEGGCGGGCVGCGSSKAGSAGEMVTLSLPQKTEEVQRPTGV